MTAFTFGSFGDIVTLTSVVITCARSLNDSTGSLADYQDFIDELSSLKEILELVIAQDQDSSTSKIADITLGTSSTTNPPLVLAAIRSHVEQCRSVMETFHKNVKSYETGLNRRGPKSWWYKMVWAMWKKDQMTSFRAKLATHRQDIVALLLVSHTDKLSRIETDIPRSVKFTLANSIELVDALGTHAFFHIECCSNWEVFDHIIKGRFKNQPGARFVQRGAYDLSCNSGKQIINPQVKPGMVFEMSIILQQRESFDKRNMCPVCGYFNSNVEVTHGFIACLGPGCNARFQVSEMDYELWDGTNDGFSQVSQSVVILLSSR
ncbi:hypothetical protein BD410DRAFT_844273 [Rickenella mellea]|uniref:Ubiquitin-like domain-containing protein n=1 Tax=Rickenella mellea TaxID=50990 RepID=A0A4Y7PP38_9AGAM|nr:hypothetical protein BD410DRAFT_844273 [Rickenella mellea]